MDLYNAALFKKPDVGSTNKNMDSRRLYSFAEFAAENFIFDPRTHKWTVKHWQKRFFYERGFDMKAMSTDHLFKFAVDQQFIE